MRWSILAIVCIGCIGTNSPPRLLSFNGIDARELYDETYPELEYVPGETFSFSFEVQDNRAQTVKSWWPWAPPGWEADPEAHEGTWEVPPDFNDLPKASLLLEDDHEYPRAAEYYIPLWREVPNAP